MKDVQLSVKNLDCQAGFTDDESSKALETNRDDNLLIVLDTVVFLEPTKHAIRVQQSTTKRVCLKC